MHKGPSLIPERQVPDYIKKPSDLMAYISQQGEGVRVLVPDDQIDIRDLLTSTLHKTYLAVNPGGRTGWLVSKKPHEQN